VGKEGKKNGKKEKKQDDRGLRRRTPWYRQERGERYAVVIWFSLLLLVFFP